MTGEYKNSTGQEMVTHIQYSMSWRRNNILIWMGYGEEEEEEEGLGASCTTQHLERTG